MIKTFELTLSCKCNFRCSYCYENHELNHQDDISWEQTKNILTFIKTYPNKTTPYFLNIFGGEPLLYKELIQKIILFLLDEKCAISIFTNGSLLDEQFLNFTKQYNHVKLHFSLDGGPEANVCRRMAESNMESFLLVNEKLQLYKRIYNLNTPLTVKSVLDPQNHYFLINTFHFITTNHNYIFDYSWNRDNNIWNDINLNEYQSSLKQAADFYIQHPNIWDYTTLFTKMYTDLQHKRSFCPAGKNRITIDGSGLIYPCSHFITCNFTIGTIADGIHTLGDNYLLLQSYNADNNKNCRHCQKFPHYNCSEQCLAEVMKLNSFKNKDMIVDENLCKLWSINADIALYVKQHCIADQRYWQNIPKGVNI